MSSASHKNMIPVSTVDPAEIHKFSEMAEQWWDEEGICKPLHLLNPIRIGYIHRTIRQHKGLSPQMPFSGLKLLDVGCGGGLLSEALARSGLEVTGIDASEKNIAIATHHALQSGVPVTYRVVTAEQVVEEGTSTYDVVLAMEIIEHVADVPLFCESLARLVKPGGLLYIATLNRTPQSFIKAILGAEYILRWLPRGTHDWKKFLKPSEICPLLQAQGMSIQAIQGVSYRLSRMQWALSDSLDTNYMILAKKDAAI